MTRRSRPRVYPAAPLRLSAGMLAALLVGLLAAVTLAPPAAYAQPSLSVDDIGTEPGLVEFQLTVRDLAAGLQLDPSDITVELDDTALAVRDAVEVDTFGEATDGTGRLVVLVIDVSDSMFGQPLADAVAAASEYADDLPDDVELAVVTAGTTARVRVEPTDDRDRVHQLLGSLFTEGSTALYDGLAAAADLVEDAGAGAERRVLVLSDGADSSSVTGLATVRQRLDEVGAPVDTVAYRTEQTVADLLDELSQDTGGRAYLAEDAVDLAGAFRRAAGAFGVRARVTAEVPDALSGAEGDLHVSVRAGDQTARTSVPVTLAVDPDAAPPPAPVSGGGLPRLAEVGVLALVFVGLLALGLVTFAPLLDRNRRRRRLAQVDQFAVARPAPASAPKAGPPDGSGGTVAKAALALSDRVVQARGMEGRLATQLDRAGMRLRPHEWLLLRGLVCVTAAILLALFVHPLAALLLGVAGGWLATSLYHRRRAEKRVQAFATLLPDALQLIIGSLRSGFSLSQAIDAMVRELPDPVASEFGRALGEARLGESLEDALARVAERMRSDDLRWAVVAIRVQQQVGGNLAEVLTTTVNTIRERDALRRHVRALSAEGRLSAWILVALPVLAGVFMFTVRTEYAMVLVTDPLGLLLLLIGILLVAVGTFWMSRVIKVEV